MMTTTTQTTARSPSAIVAFYALLIRFANQLQSPLLLLIRVYIGYQCIISGQAHITHFQNMVQQFKDWNVPTLPKNRFVDGQKINVAFSAVTEIVCGTCLLVGLASRLISIPLIGNFIVAFLTVNLSDPHYRQLLHNFWNNQDVLLKDDAFPFLMTSIVILIFGPGYLSIDGLIKFVRRK
jgi:putative oxidoreductase